MKNTRRFVALMLTALLLLSSMPMNIASAYEFWCPNDGLDHNWGETRWEDKGQCGTIWGVRYCKRCGYSVDVSKERDHDWGPWKVVKKGTDCQSWDGLKESTCKRCGETSQDEVTGSHKWGSWKTTKEATCTQEGKRERKCSLCGKKETETIAKKSHSYGEWVVVQEAAEGQVGIRERKCSKCGHVQREEFYPDGTVKKGDRGDTVKEVQEALNDEGYNAGKADGIFGNGTESAVKDWQEDNGYEPDGILWPGQVGDLLGEDESENSPVRIELLLKEGCAPANGEYFAQGEAVDYIVRLTIEDGYTAKNLIVGDLLYPQEIDGFPNAIAYFETATSADNTEWIYTHRVTASEVELLNVINQAAAFWDAPDTGEGMNAISEVVRVPAGGEAKSSYASGIDLELLTDCSKLSGMLGQTIPVRVRITNTGETTLTVNSSYMCDGSGNQPDSIDYVRWDQVTSSYDESSWFMGGSVMEGTLNIVVEQSDIEAGVIVRKYTERARPFYAYVNGEITDVPADIEPRPEGTTGWRVKEEEMVEDTIEIVIPLAKSGADQGYETAIDLELLTDPSKLAGNLGDTVTVDLKVTNIGETIVTMNSYMMHDGNGEYAEADYKHSWNERTNEPLASWFMPGDTLTTAYDIVVTQADVDRGEIVRVFTQEAREFYYPNNEVARPGYVYGEEGTLHTIWETPASDAVTIRIPIGDKNHVPQPTGLAFTLEVLTDTTGMVGSVNHWFNIEMKLTNVGTEAIDLAYNQCFNGKGSWCATEVDLFRWWDGSCSGATKVEGLAPGESITGMLQINVTEADIAYGEIVREFHQGVTGPSIAGHYATEHVVIRIPITEKDNFTVEKTVENAPLNGQYFVEGEKVEYMILVLNDEHYGMADLEVYDPLKGSNEDMLVELYPEVLPLSGMKSWFTHTVTAEDVARGYITNQAHIRWYNPAREAFGELSSNVVTVRTGGENGPTLSGGKGEAPMVSFTKKVVNPPANGEFYAMGENIVYRLDIVNCWNKPIYDIAIEDPLFSEVEENYVYSIPELKSGEEYTVYYNHKVTADEAEQGYVDNSALMYWNYDGAENIPDIQSNYVRVPAGYAQNSGLVITKKEISRPANGYFYIPGESVFFEVTVTNPTNHIYTDVVVHDLLYDDSGFQRYDSIGAGFYQDWTLEFVVNDVDAAAGYLCNIAYVEGNKSGSKGKQNETAYSPAVIVPTGFDHPFGVFNELEVIKKETSTPANGKFYTKGEKITYAITYTNIGEMPFDEILIYDSQEAYDAPEIASEIMLTPGDSRTCYYEHVVDDEDVAQGYVINIAYAYGNISGVNIAAASNIVESDTDGNSMTVYRPNSGKINVDKLQIDKQGNTKKQSYCSCTIKGWNGENAIEYEAYFCPKHVAAEESIRTMLSTAKTEEELVKVWEYAFVLYQIDADALYNDLIAAADEAAKINLQIERIRFLTLNGTTRYAMIAAIPEQKAYITEIAAKAWRDKTVNMCYEAGTAPGKRTDSLLNIKMIDTPSETPEYCGCSIAEEKGEKMLYADLYCAEHGFTWKMTNLMLSGEVTEHRWAQIRTMWDLELRNAYNALYEKVNDYDGRVYLAEYAAFTAWLESREAAVNMLYPNNPEICAEIMTGEIMKRTMDVCERMK